MTSSFPVSKLEDTLTEMKRVFKEILQSDEIKRFDDLLEGIDESILPDIQQMFQKSVADKLNWNAECLREFMLSLRLPIPLSTAMPFVFDVDTNHSDQVSRAASLLVAIGQIYRDSNMMKDVNSVSAKRATKENNLDRMLLAACRVPGKEKDEHVIHKDVRHVLVIRKNNMFVVDILDKDNHVIPAGLLVQQLQHILDHQTDNDRNFFALTALPRTDWFHTRMELLKEEVNQRSLAKAESSLVAIILEEGPSPKTLADTLQHVRLGEPGSRYYDKLVNVVVYSDGQAGVVIDHTCSDGYVAGKLCMLISKLAHDLEIDSYQYANSSYPGRLYISQPNKNPPTSVWDHLDRDITTFHFPVSSDLIHILKKAHVQDAWLQMSLQHAIFELTGALSVLLFEPTYIDNFENGGTDATFPVSAQSRELVRRMKEGLPTGSLMTSLTAALSEHRRLIKNTKMGKAYGSHISVLESLLKSQVPDHPMLPYLQRFQMPDVIMTGASEGGHRLRAAAGNVFAENQLVVTYLVKGNEITFVLTTRGMFSAMLPNIPDTLSRSLKQLLRLIVCHTSANVMIKTSISETKTKRYASKAEYTTYLSQNPNTPGTVILQHERHLCGSRLLENMDELVSFMMYGKSLAMGLQTSLGVQRCGMIYLFLPRDKPQMHIIPLYGLGKEWVAVVAKEHEFSSVYKGYVTTVDGPRISDEQLTLVQQKLVASEKVTEWNKSFHGDPKDDNLFARLIRGEVQQWRICEDDNHIAFLTPFPNTIGFTVVIPRRHLSSDIIGLPDDDVTMLFTAVHKVITILMRSLAADGCAVVCEGMEIDYAHVKVIPVYGAGSCEQNVPIEFHETYPGFVCTKPGPEMDITKLTYFAKKLAI